MSIKNLRSNSRGDTIVEVLICIAILGFIVASAYTLTNKNQLTAQQSQERGEALKVANTELELLRGYAQSQPLDALKNSYFCITITGGVLTTVPVSAPPATAAADNLTGYPAACQSGTNNRYKVAFWGYCQSGAINADTTCASPGKHVFGVTVRWDSVKSATHEEVKTFYTTYDSTATTAPSDIPLGSILTPLVLNINPASASWVLTLTPPLQFTITNVGLLPVHITTTAIGGANPTAFSVVGTNFCANTALAGGASCTVTVKYNSGLPGPPIKSGRLIINNSDGIAATQAILQGIL